jgi:ABC-type multidrug transport system fused ATPase/permease subunit
MMIIGSIASIANGCIMPVFLLVFTGIIDSFSSFGSSLCGYSSLNSTLNNTSNQTAGNSSAAATVLASAITKLQDQLKTQSYYLIGLALITMILQYFQIAFWLMPAEKQTNKIRNAFFQAILKQDIGWFDVYKSAELTNRLTE